MHYTYYHITYYVHKTENPLWHNLFQINATSKCNTDWPGQRLVVKRSPDCISKQFFWQPQPHIIAQQQLQQQSQQHGERQVDTGSACIKRAETGAPQQVTAPLQGEAAQDPPASNTFQEEMQAIDPITCTSSGHTHQKRVRRKQNKLSRYTHDIDTSAGKKKVGQRKTPHSCSKLHPTLSISLSAQS